MVSPLLGTVTSCFEFSLVCLSLPLDTETLHNRLDSQCTKWRTERAWYISYQILEQHMRCVDAKPKLESSVHKKRPGKCAEDEG